MNKEEIKALKERAILWNKLGKEVGRTDLVNKDLTEKNIEDLRKVSLSQIENLGLKLSFTSKSNSFRFNKMNEGILICPTIASPTLRAISDRGNQKTEFDTLKLRLRAKAGPIGSLWLEKNLTCEFSSVGSAKFEKYENLSIDHLISQRTLMIGFLLGKIEKSQYHARNNLTLMRLSKNAEKSSKNLYTRSLNTSYKDETKNKKEITDFLRTDFGIKILSLRKPSLRTKSGYSFNNYIVKAAIFYFCHSKLETPYYQKNKVEKTEFFGSTYEGDYSFVASQLLENHKEQLEGSFLHKDLNSIIPIHKKWYNRQLELQSKKS